MSRESAPDENTRWQNWNDTVKHACSTYQKALDASGDTRERLLQQAKQILDGVPDAHPEKSSLMHSIKSIL